MKKLVPAVIDDLVRVCVTEHRDNNLQPDKVGKRESTYVQCYDKLQLYLLESGESASPTAPRSRLLDFPNYKTYPPP